MLQECSKQEVATMVTRECSRLEKLVNDELDPYTQNQHLFETLSKRRNRDLMQEVLLSVTGLPTNTQYSSETARTRIQAVFERCQRKSLDE